MRPLPAFYAPCVILVTDHASFNTKNLEMNGTAVINTLLPDLQTRSELLPATHAHINDKRSVFASRGGGGETTFRPTRLAELASSVTSKVTCVLLTPSPPQERNLCFEILPQGSKPATCMKLVAWQVPERLCTTCRCYLASKYVTSSLLHKVQV